MFAIYLIAIDRVLLFLMPSRTRTQASLRRPTRRFASKPLFHWASRSNAASRSGEPTLLLSPDFARLAWTFSAVSRARVGRAGRGHEPLLRHAAHSACRPPCKPPSFLRRRLPAFHQRRATTLRARAIPSKSPGRPAHTPCLLRPSFRDQRACLLCPPTLQARTAWRRARWHRRRGKAGNSGWPTLTKGASLFPQRHPPLAGERLCRAEGICSNRMSLC